jgi:hypothetical protein
MEMKAEGASDSEIVGDAEAAGYRRKLKLHEQDYDPALAEDQKDGPLG